MNFALIDFPDISDNRESDIESEDSRLQSSGNDGGENSHSNNEDPDSDQVDQYENDDFDYYDNAHDESDHGDENEYDQLDYDAYSGDDELEVGVDDENDDNRGEDDDDNANSDYYQFDEEDEESYSGSSQGDEGEGEGEESEGYEEGNGEEGHNNSLDEEQDDELEAGVEDENDNNRGEDYDENANSDYYDFDEEDEESYSGSSQGDEGEGEGEESEGYEEGNGEEGHNDSIDEEQDDDGTDEEDNHLFHDYEMYARANGEDDNGEGIRHQRGEADGGHANDEGYPLNPVRGEADQNPQPHFDDGDDNGVEFGEIEKIRTHRGQRHYYIALDGYLYTHKKNYYPTDGGPRTETWECKKRTHNSTANGDQAECLVRLLLKGDTIRFSKKRTVHTHPPDNADIEVARTKARLLDQAENSDARPSVVVSRALFGISNVADGRLPDESSLYRTVRRKRAGQADRPVDPGNVQEIPIPLPHRYTIGPRGEPWLQWDSQDATRTLIFASERCLDVLANCAHWFMDGTFAVSPRAYHQLYTVHGLVGLVNVPCVYILMRRRTQHQYERVFAILKRLRRMRPSSVLVDFEHPSINALRHEFPRAAVKGCYFHLTQSVWKYIQRTPGAKWAYQHIPEFSMTCRMIPAIAFLPPARMKRALRFLTMYAVHYNHHLLLQDTIEYFAMYYTGTSHTEPMFPRELWSVADRVSDALPKTNNALEGWHHGFSTHLGCDHPSLWAFLDALREQNAKQHLKQVHAEQVRRLTTKRRSMWSRVQLANIWARYRDHLEDLNTPLHGPTVIMFLRAVAYNFRMV